jgi:hypothetical protein
VRPVSDTGINNVKDLVSKIRATCASGDTLANLTIMGHGNEWGQFIGTDWVSVDTLSKFRGDLATITGCFGTKGEVVMGGCRVGRNGRLLLELSNILGVPVSRFTALQRPGVPGDEGGRTTCFITCTRQGFTTADKIDEIQLKIMDWFQNRSTRNTAPVVLPPAPQDGPRNGNAVVQGSITIECVPHDRDRSSLSAIARKQYNDPMLWPLIHDFNKTVIGYNPNRVKAGIKVIVQPLSSYSQAEINDAKKRGPTWKGYTH